MNEALLRKIADRRCELVAERERIDAERDAKVAALNAEMNELEVAARVIERLEASPSQHQTSIGSMGAEVDDKPKPTVPIMVQTILGERMAAGLPGATGSELQTSINQRWGIHDPNHIRPALWRLTQTGRLRKEGDVYMLPQSTESHVNG